MNKRELIKHFEEMEYVSIHQMGKKAFIDMIEQLDEPKKPVVPQFVADWLKYCKRTGVDLYHALEMGDLYFCNYANQKDDLKLKDFFETENNQELFARAWLDGYEVEKEKRYYVKAKKIADGCNYLNCRTSKNEWSFAGISEPIDYRTRHTRKELEEAGFGEVFDSPLFEVEEVEE